ncbi:MAG TPA: hypothetical protein VFG68_19695 [Fimbriiglobus sp.]|nr:hypothetical protein [Fimbriiglobus sp.]
MTPAHRTEAVLSEDGKLSLDNLPFRAGQAVEVIVLPAVRPDAPDPEQTEESDWLERATKARLRWMDENVY